MIDRDYCGPDALLRMAAERKGYMALRKAKPDTYGASRVPFQRQRYLKARRNATRIVDLPSDYAHLMPSAETCAYFNALARAA